jgi:hypothetical protein
MNLLTTSPALSLPFVLRALRDGLGRWCGRGVLTAALAWLVYQRVGAIVGRLERLAARFAAGRLVRRHAARRGVVPVTEGDAAAACLAASCRAPMVRAAMVRVWPQGFAWLIPVGAHEAAGIGLHLRAVLAHPEMVVLLGAAPQVRRLLTPVCRMLGVEASLLRPVQVSDADAGGRSDGAETGAVGRSGRPRSVGGAARVPLASVSRIALPRGVLAAARRGGFARGS